MTILINEKGINIFQLSKKEVLVLDILYRNSPLTLSQLVRTTKIPRTNLYRVVKKLKERGFINHRGPSTQLCWFIESEENIIYILQNFISSPPSPPPFSPSHPDYQP